MNLPLFDHPYLRWHVSGAAARQHWSSSAALLVVTDGRVGETLTALGDPAEVARLVAVAAAERPDVRRLSVPRGTLDRLGPAQAARVDEGADWDWMWTDAPPPLEAGVARITDDAGIAELAELLAAFSPRASAAPDSPSVERWVGLHAEAHLAAVAANEPVVPGVPHLASVATVPEHRGRGLAGAVSGALTRALLAEGAPVVTLGMYADNDAARAVYARLGFRLGVAFSTRALLPAAP